MRVKEQLQADLTTAMKANDVRVRDTLRLVLAAVQQVEVDEQRTLDDAGVLDVLQKQAKQRRESVADYRKANRPEQAAGEQAELEVIERYLPQQLDVEAIRTLAQKVIADLGVTDSKGTGQVMGRLMAQLQGKADGRVVNQVVRELLT